MKRKLKIRSSLEAMRPIVAVTEVVKNVARLVRRQRPHSPSHAKNKLSERRGSHVAL